MQRGLAKETVKQYSFLPNGLRRYLFEIDKLNTPTGWFVDLQAGCVG